MSEEKDDLTKLPKNLLEATESQLDHLWNGADDFYTWIMQEDVPEADEIEDDVDLRSHLNSHVKYERWVRIDEGCKLKPSEVRFLQKKWVEFLLDDNPDHDRYSTGGLVKYKPHKAKAEWVILERTGYSFSMVSTGFIGSYKTKREALSYLKSKGHIG